jgi:Tol biopolymer transport system component
VTFVGPNGNILLWREGEEAVALTNWGGASRVKISDDGTIVAFERGGDLWMVRADGTDERQLVSADDFEQAGVSLYRFKWVPGIHTLAFNTSLNLDHGLALNDDLQLVNADTLEQTFLLPSGEGGEFYYSPDGSQVAISTGNDSIVLYDADGGNQRLSLNYTPVSTASEFKYYAQPVWATDSSSLRVAIPPPDPYVDPQLTSIFRLDTDDGPGQPYLMGTLEIARMGQPVFSPDLSQVAYLQSTEGSAPGVHQAALAVANLDQYTVGESTSYYPEASLIYGWSPDSNHFAFLTNSQQPTAMIGQLGNDPFPAFEPEGGTDDSFYTAVIDVTWVDDTRYLFLAINPRGWDILLGELFTTDVTLVGFVPGAPPSFDFTN